MSTPTSTSTGQLTGTVYHWVMTVQTGNGMQATYDGTTQPLAPGTTRTAYYKAVREHLATEVGTDRFTVLFFAMDRDAL
ncbi:hypothetical protein [Streptacidiphilus sp. PAMC 29251]